MTLELDHIFVFVADEKTAREMMSQAGLRINYSRAHPGQGTTNVCACLDDMFIELIWLDGTDISAESERVSLGARGRGAGSRLGISWRGETDRKTTPYAAPFLPEGVTIPVLEDSLDAGLPFIFRTPGGKPPIERTDGLVGDRQAPHFTTLSAIRCFVEAPRPLQSVLSDFSNISAHAGSPRIEIDINGPDGEVAKSICWDLAVT